MTMIQLIEKLPVHEKTFMKEFISFKNEYNETFDDEDLAWELRSLRIGETAIDKYKKENWENL